MTPENFKVGAATLAEWFGAGGGPVAVIEANRRAEVCAHCPRNRIQSYRSRWGDYAAVVVSLASWLRGKHLKTAFDHELGVCEACDCPMRVKVWCPKGIILRHMPSESQEKLWEKCWLR